MATKIRWHLDRFRAYHLEAYGHDGISTVGSRDVAGWQRELAKVLAPDTVNNHRASLSGFMTWIDAQITGSVALGHPDCGCRCVDAAGVGAEVVDVEPGPVTEKPV